MDVLEQAYLEATTWLFEQFPAYHEKGAAAYNPGLKNCTELAAFFDNPQDHLTFIHVGGTNGKGSTSNMLASILTESGETVGLFTSPHLFDFTERIRVHGVCIDKAFVVDFCQKIRSREWNIAPSFFEITWVMALCYFKEKNCSIVVAEVGMGGRLDATNIITPILSIITNIGLDHTQFLGDTRAAIAVEKAGIMKRGVPVLIGESDEEINPVFTEQARQHEAVIRPLVDPPAYPENLIGYQRQNFKLVFSAVEVLREHRSITNEHIQDGIKHVYPNTGFMGRLQLIASEPRIMLDCAHNAHGIRACLESILPLQGQLHIVYGTSSDKNMEEIATLLPADAHYYFTTFSNPRSAKLEQLEKNFASTGKNRIFFTDPRAALQQAQLFANKADTILIFGSFFLVHDFFEDFFKNPLAETK